jgi:hypothetical protein
MVSQEFACDLCSEKHCLRMLRDADESSSCHIVTNVWIKVSSPSKGGRKSLT